MCEIIVYTDGSFIEPKSGFGIYILNYSKKNICISGPVPLQKHTNQVAELYAIYYSMTFLEHNNCSNRPLVIYTDSKYCIGCLTLWYKKWIKNGWKNSKGKQVENSGLISNILNKVKSWKEHIKFLHVKAHSGIYENEMADKLANQGRLSSNIKLSSENLINKSNRNVTQNTNKTQKYMVIMKLYTNTTNNNVFNVEKTYIVTHEQLKYLQRKEFYESYNNIYAKYIKHMPFDGSAEIESFINNVENTNLVWLFQLIYKSENTNL